MKRIVVFLGLKVLEISALLCIPYGVGKIMTIFPKYITALEVGQVCFWSMWIVGFVTILMSAVAIMILALIGLVCYANWEKAGKIVRKKAR